MAKKKRAKKRLGIGTLAGIAGVFVFFVSMFNPMNAAAIAVIFLFGFSAYKFLSSK